MSEINVTVGVVTKGEDVLILRRVNKEPGLDWAFPAGKKEKNEDNATAVMREVLEETDVIVRPVETIGEKHHPINPSIKLTYIHCEYVSGAARVCEPDKHEDVCWVKPSCLPQLFERDYTPFVRDFFANRPV